MKHPELRRRKRGFTLVEVMVVVLIIGILSAIAIPSYRSYVLRVTRTDAKVELTKMAQLLERCFTRFNAYNDGGCTTGLPYDTQEATYTISGVVNNNNFVLTATPINGQADDAECGSFTLNQTDTRGVVGASRTAVQCW